MPREQVPSDQLLVLQTIYAWRFEGRSVARGKNAGTLEKQQYLPVYLLQAELTGKSMDVCSLLDLLERKRLVEWGRADGDATGSWRLPDGKTVETETDLFENDPNDFLIIIGFRTKVWIDGQLVTETGDSRCVDLTPAGIAHVESAKRRTMRKRPRAAKASGGKAPPVQTRIAGGVPCEDLRARAELYVRGQHGVFPGIRPLARALSCPESSLSNAIDDSLYLKARKAEYMKNRRRPSVEPLNDVLLDRQPQDTEPGILEVLVAEQEAECKADEAMARRQRCSRPRS